MTILEIVAVAVVVGAFTSAGISVLIYGYKLGFKASYEIRRGLTGEDTDQGLLAPDKEPAEFALVDEKEEEKE